MRDPARNQIYRCLRGAARDRTPPIEKGGGPAPAASISRGTVCRTRIVPGPADRPHLGKPLLKLVLGLAANSGHDRHRHLKLERKRERGRHNVGRGDEDEGGAVCEGLGRRSWQACRSAQQVDRDGDNFLVGGLRAAWPRGDRGGADKDPQIYLSAAYRCFRSSNRSRR